MGKLFIAEFAAPINDALPAPPRATQQVEIGPAAVRSKPFTQGTQRIRIHSDEPCLVFFRDDESERLPADTDRVYAVTPGASIAVMQSDEAGFGGSASTIEGLLAVLSDQKKYSGLLADLQTKAADAKSAALNARKSIAEMETKAKAATVRSAELDGREKAVAEGEARLRDSRAELDEKVAAFARKQEEGTAALRAEASRQQKASAEADAQHAEREKKVAFREKVADKRESDVAAREAELARLEKAAADLQAEYERKIANLREALG